MEQSLKPSGAKLRSLRKQRGLTQIELGQLAGVSNIAISQAEQDKREMHPSTIGKLAKALGVSPGEFWE